MATFTVTTAQNIDALTGKTGGDIYNINGGTLTIDQDSRFGQNNSNASATLATSMGNITLSATLGGILDVDARFVRIIPYNSGTGNVPTLGTTITQGGASGKLISVMATLTSLPTAVGVAMPATGFIKIKAWNSVAFTAGALTGIGASATGADTVGWIEIVGDESATCNVPRLGTARFRGEKYQLGTTNGVANQTFQIPTQGLAALYCPGVYIEKTVGSNDYEFYPNAGSQTAVATDIRAKVVWISTAGLVRIGHNGTANAGFLPVTGLKVVIPNIILQNCTTAARNANALPNVTLATRYDFVTTGGGVIDMSHVYGAWYLSFIQAFSVTLSHVAVMEQISVSEIGSPMIWSKVGVGQTGAQSQAALSMTFCFAGGTFTDCHWSRATLAASGNYTVALTDISDFTFVGETQTALTAKGNVSTGNTIATRVVRSHWTNLKLIGGRMACVTCTNISVTGWSYADRISGTTTTTAAENSYVFEVGSNTNGFLSSGGNFFGITNVQPYLGILNIVAAGCANIKMRNIGTRAVPLSLGSTNNGAYLIVIAAGAAASDIKIQRCYVSNTRTGLWTGDNSSTRITLEKVFGDYTDAPVSPMLNFLAKGVGCTHPLTAQTAVYGTHFIDYFTTTTVGRIAILMNEATSLTSSQVTLANNANFTSAGGLYMPTIGMSATFEMPYFALGHTSFQNTAGVMAGGTIGNYTLEYQIDKNNGSGYNGTWKALSGANLSGETGIDASLGVKLKVRITTSVTNSTAITSLYILTNSSTTAQDYEYPLDTANIEVNGMAPGSRVKITRVDTNAILEHKLESGGSATFQADYIGAIRVEVRKASSVPYYQPYVTQINTVSGTTSQVTALQVLDQ